MAWTFTVLRPIKEHRTQVRKRLGIAEDEIVVRLALVMTRQKEMHLGIEAFGRPASRYPALCLLVVGGRRASAAHRAVD